MDLPSWNTHGTLRQKALKKREIKNSPNTPPTIKTTTKKSDPPKTGAPSTVMIPGIIGRLPGEDEKKLETAADFVEKITEHHTVGKAMEGMIVSLGAEAKVGEAMVMMDVEGVHKSIADSKKAHIAIPSKEGHTSTDNVMVITVDNVVNCSTASSSAKPSKKVLEKEANVDVEEEAAAIDKGDSNTL